MKSAEKGNGPDRTESGRTAASGGETVKEAIEAICELAVRLYDKEVVEHGEIKDVWSLVMQVENRIEAAHNREVAELRRCLKEAVFVMQTLFDKQMPKWRKALDGAD